MKKTYEEIISFVQAANSYQNRLNPELKDPEKNKGFKPRENRLTYAIQRVSKSIQKPLNRANDQCEAKLEDAKVDYATLFPQDYEKLELRGCLVIVDGEYQYTPDNDKKRRQAQIAAQREKLETGIEFEPHYVKDVPKDLTSSERDAFVDFVIRAEQVSEADAGPEETDDESKRMSAAAS